jgi:arsenate reductase (thioredoxin)
LNAVHPQQATRDRPRAATSAQADSDGAAALNTAHLLPALRTLAEKLPLGFPAIPEERKQQLDMLASFLRTRREAGDVGRVVFICTHNSRRSHLGQLFATLAAAHYGLDRIEAYSGGTEATAFNPRAVAALERLGFAIGNPGGENPHYRVAFAEDRPPAEVFSKRYDDPSNPKQGFAAVMTCDQADKSCPMVAGAKLRIPLHYVDPKVADGTPAEAAAYDERAMQIATEMFYLFSRVRG